ncbi:hypothetical protein [Paenibacillus chitinolyticus]
MPQRRYFGAMDLLWRFNTGDAGCPHKADTVFPAFAAAATTFDWQQRLEREKPVSSHRAYRLSVLHSASARFRTGFLPAFPGLRPAGVPLLS